MKLPLLWGLIIVFAGLLFTGLFQLNEFLSEAEAEHSTSTTDPALPDVVTREVLIGQWTRVGSRKGAPIPGRPEKTAIKTLVTYEADGTMHGRTWVPGATNRTQTSASGQWTFTNNTLSITFLETNTITSTLSITNNLLQTYTKEADLYVYYKKVFPSSKE